MPSGKAHDRITYLALIPAGAFVYGYTQSPSVTFLSCAGLLFGGLMFGPDLDTRSVQYYRWGWLRWIWWPYQHMFSHRSRWTHGLFLGLFTRLLYFSTLVVFISALLAALHNTYYQPLAWKQLVLAGSLEAQQLDRPHLLGALAGLWLGGALHSWADWLHSRLRRARHWPRPGRSSR